MSDYPEPRRVVLTWAQAMSLTVLEQARACVLAGISQADVRRLLRVVASSEGSPDDLVAGTLLYYAVAYQLELRLDPEATWADAQTWRVVIDAGARDPIAEAEADATVRTAVATGLTPAEAGELTLAQVDAFATVRAEQRSHRRRAR